MLATFINAGAILLGGLIGLLLKKYISDSFQKVVMISAGVTTLVLGIQMGLAAPSALANLFALIIGGFIGFGIKLEDRILGLGNKIGGSGFGPGFLNASLLFCTGAMAVVGSIEAGTSGDYNLILIKSVMDGFSSIVFVTAYGIGVFASVVTVIVYQGFFTLAGSTLQPLLGEAGIGAISSVGGMMLILLALNLLDIKNCHAGNFLPAIILAPFTQFVYSLLPL